MRYKFASLIFFALTSCKTGENEAESTSQIETKYNLFEIRVNDYDISKEKPVSLLEQVGDSDGLFSAVYWTVFYGYEVNEMVEIQGQQMSSTAHRSGRIIVDDSSDPMIFYQLKKSVSNSEVVVEVPKYVINASVSLFKNGEVVGTKQQSSSGEKTMKFNF